MPPREDLHDGGRAFDPPRSVRDAFFEPRQPGRRPRSSRRRTRRLPAIILAGNPPTTSRWFMSSDLLIYYKGSADLFPFSIGHLVIIMEAKAQVRRTTEVPRRAQADGRGAHVLRRSCWALCTTSRTTRSSTRSVTFISCPAGPPRQVRFPSYPRRSDRNTSVHRLFWRHAGSCPAAIPEGG